MIEEQLISAETAKLAKDKGCDLELYKGNWEYESEGDTFVTNYDPRTDYPEAKEVSECNQSLLQKWLRDEHDLHIEVIWDVDGELYWVGSITTIGDTVSEDRFTNTSRLGSFEEALEAGLLQALELI